MKVLKTVPSRERCAESGWYASDLLLERPMDAPFIRSLREFGGSFVFLSMLKKPFFKLESDYYMLKGCLGDDFLRVAVHDGHREELERARVFIEERE